MTGPYDWNPMPHRLDVRCPKCGEPARFEFATAVRVKRTDEREFFERSSHFDCRTIGEGTRSRWVAALFHATLHGAPEQVIADLPPGYEPSHWRPPRNGHRCFGTDAGAVRCPSCGLGRRHTLRWPHDAHYQIEVRGHVLWAFHRESALELRQYIASDHRRREGFRWELMLRHVPGVFLSSKVRSTVVERLDRLL